MFKGEGFQFISGKQKRRHIKDLIDRKIEQDNGSRRPWDIRKPVPPPSSPTVMPDTSTQILARKNAEEMRRKKNRGS